MNRFRYAYEYASRRRIWKLQKAVSQAFHKIDPEQLYSLGCPADEYDPEIREIAENIDRERGMTGALRLSAEEIANIVALVMHRAYGEWRKPIEVIERDRNLAAAILQFEQEPEQKRDACQICDGWSGGVPGNENIIEGIKVCDYCSVKIDRYKALREERKGE